jgi:hypothetical protein
VAERPAVDHLAHDELLIAAWVSGDTDPEDAARAADLTARCDDCRDLATDLRELRAATRALPPLSRTRDFRLTPVDAERLRARPGWLDRVRAAAGAGFARPLAGAMTAIGLAGLLLTTTPLGGPTATTDRDVANVEVGQESSSTRDGAEPPAAGGQGAAAAPSAAAPAASGEPMPVAASRDEEAYLGSPVPGDAAAPGEAGPSADRGSDTQASPPAAAQVPAPSPTNDLTPRTTDSPTTTPTGDLVRPAAAVASAVLLAGGLLLLVLTRRRRHHLG